MSVFKVARPYILTIALQLEDFIQVSISIASVLCAKPLAILAVRLAEILIQMKAIPSPITKESDLLAYSVKYAKNSEIVL